MKNCIGWTCLLFQSQKASTFYWVIFNIIADKKLLICDRRRYEVHILEPPIRRLDLHELSAHFKRCPKKSHFHNVNLGPCKMDAQA